MIRVAIALAIAAVVVAIGVFVVPYAFDEQTSWSATVGSTLTNAIALMLGAIALLVPARVESSDYKAEQQTKTDIARLMATLAMILTKGALVRTGQIKNPDFSREVAAIDAFAHSTTGFAMFVLAGEKSRMARNKSEEWRVFFMYIAELVARADEPSLVINRAVRLQEMMLKLTREDLRRIGKSVSNLVSGISDFDAALDENVVVKAMRSVVNDEHGGADDEERNALVRRKFEFLKAQGVDDPEVDMFLAVWAGDTAELQNAIDRGANVNATDTAVLRRHEVILRTFKP